MVTQSRQDDSKDYIQYKSYKGYILFMMHSIQSIHKIQYLVFNSIDELDIEVDTNLFDIKCCNGNYIFCSSTKI